MNNQEWAQIASLVGASIGIAVVSRGLPKRIFSSTRLAIRKFFESADTKTKRKFLLATPFIWMATIILVMKDGVVCIGCYRLLNIDEANFSTVIFIILSAAIPIAAVTKVTDWINAADR